MKAKSTNYYQEHKEEVLERTNKNYQEHKEEYQEKSRQRYAEDPILRLTKCVRGRIYESLKGQLHGEKLGKTEELVDCSSMEALMAKLEQDFISGMTRQNYGEWHTTSQ